MKRPAILFVAPVGCNCCWFCVCCITSAVPVIDAEFPRVRFSNVSIYGCTAHDILPGPCVPFQDRLGRSVDRFRVDDGREGCGVRGCRKKQLRDREIIIRWDHTLAMWRWFFKLKRIFRSRLTGEWHSVAILDFVGHRFLAIRIPTRDGSSGASSRAPLEGWRDCKVIDLFL